MKAIKINIISGGLIKFARLLGLIVASVRTLHNHYTK